MYCVHTSNGYGDLPAVTVSWFWINRVESRAGMITPHFGRKMQLLPLSLSLFPISGPFNKRVKTRLSYLPCVRQWSPRTWKAINTLVISFKKEPRFKMSDTSRSQRIEALESSMRKMKAERSRTRAQIEQTMGMMQQLLQAKSADRGQ